MCNRCKAEHPSNTNPYTAWATESAQVLNVIIRKHADRIRHDKGKSIEERLIDFFYEGADTLIDLREKLREEPEVVVVTATGMRKLGAEVERHITSCRCIWCVSDPDKMLRDN